MSWFGLGLGIAQVAAPGQMTKLLGLRDTDGSRRIMRLVGLREIISGAILAAGVGPRLGMALRVGGDLSDLAMLGASLRQRRVNQPRILGAMGAVAGALAVDVYGAVATPGPSDRPHSPTSSDRLRTTTSTIVVNRPPEELYRFWLRFDQFPRFMRHLEQVSVRKDGRSHWKARGPGGAIYEWDAEMVENRPNELITWRSLPSSDVENEGSVRFERAPGGRGTLVRVNLRYDPPAGLVGSAVAMLLGREPGQEVQEDLRRFKQIVETGEVVLSDATVHGRSHPARPPEGTWRLPKPLPDTPSRPAVRQDVPAARQDVPAARQDVPAGESWPEPDDRPSRRADADDVAAPATTGGSR